MLTRQLLEKGFWRDKRVFITGGTGFIGSWLCLTLLELGAKVYTASRSEGSPDGLFFLCRLKDRVTVFKGDIRDKTFLRESVAECRPDVVFHLAAQPIYAVANEKPFYTYETNIIGTLNVIESCRMADVKRIVFATSKHWDGRALDNVGVYASSKACSEIVINSLNGLFKGTNPKMSIVRMQNIVGGGDCELSRIVPYCLNCLNNEKEIQLIRPDSEMSFAYVMDMIIFLLSVAQDYNDTCTWDCLCPHRDREKLRVEDIKNEIEKRFWSNLGKNVVPQRTFTVSDIWCDGKKMPIVCTTSKSALDDTVYINKLLKNEDISLRCKEIVLDYINFAI